MTQSPTAPYIWIDGNIKSIEDGSIHILSHSLHYGSAVFEGIRAYQSFDGKTAIFRAQEHYERLIRSLQALQLKTDFSVQDFVDATKSLIKKNNIRECYIRPLGFVDHQLKGLKLPANTKAHVMIAVWNWGKYLGAESAAKGIRVGISSFRRPDPASSLPWAKISGNYVNSILARQEATLAGFDEAILLDQNGYIAEGSGENIFVVKDGKLKTPDTSSILPGITRATVLDFCKDLKLEVAEAHITRNEIYNADEVFFTGTAAEITPIREIDGRTIGLGSPGPISHKIIDLFEKTVRGNNPLRKNWLSFVDE